MKRTRWPGNWKVTCHVCGFWYPSSEIKRRWDGLLVCEKDYETRHPQTLIKIRGETSVPEFVSKDVDPDQYVPQCDLWTSSPMADYGTADCARVGGNTSIPLLMDTFTPSAIAGIAIAGFSAPGFGVLEA